jgi:hypothetical protein
VHGYLFPAQSSLSLAQVRAPGERCRSGCYFRLGFASAGCARFGNESAFDKEADGLCARGKIVLFATPFVHSLQKSRRNSHFESLSFFLHWRR